MAAQPRTALQLRRMMLAACMAALAAFLWRAAGLAGEFARDRDAARLYQQGLALVAAGEYASAAGVFRSVLALAPHAVESYGALAEAEFRQKRYDQAVAVYRRWLAIYPYTYVGALYREVGLIELRAERPADARKDLLQATFLDPSDWQAFHLLGHAQRRLSDLAAARAAWEQVIRLNPDFQPAYEQLRHLRN